MSRIAAAVIAIPMAVAAPPPPPVVYARPPVYVANPPVYAAPPQVPARVAWCQARYRTYNPYNNTWVDNYGQLRVCVSPYG